MIRITGKTWGYKDLFREWRGRWSAGEGWTFDRLTPAQIEQLKTMPGCIVAHVADPEPVDHSDPEYDALNVATVPQRTKFYGDDPTYVGVFKHHAAAFFGFSSLTAFADYIDHMPREKRQHYGWEDDGESFSGTATMREAIDLARNGWVEGAELASLMSEQMTLDRPRIKKRRKAIAGGSVNVGRMLSGDPAHMVRRPKQPGSKIITLYVECGYNGGIRATNAAIRAAMIAAMVDIMENNGYSCSIVAVDLSVQRTTPYYQLAVQLKDAGERLNMSDVVFGLGHPSFLRRFSFAACSSERETEPIWRDQGSAANSFDDKHRPGRNSFHIPSFSYAMQSAMTENPMLLLPWLIPDGMPLDVGVWV